MTRWTLPPEKVPSAWFNVAPHLPKPLEPCLPFSAGGVVGRALGQSKEVVRKQLHFP